MVRFTASEARKRISDVLNGAEQGETVVIERRGVRFRVVIDRLGPIKTVPAGKAPVLEIRDPGVEAGTWTWRPERGGLKFSRRSSRLR